MLHVSSEEHSVCVYGWWFSGIILVCPKNWAVFQNVPRSLNPTTWDGREDIGLCDFQETSQGIGQAG